MALMESPAVIVGVMLAPRGASDGSAHVAGLLKEAFVNGSVFLSLGSLAIGLLTGERGQTVLHPFTDDPCVPAPRPRRARPPSRCGRCFAGSAESAS